MKGDIGFTERIFITKVAVLSVVCDHPKYHSIIGILQIAVYFGLQLHLNITSYLKSLSISVRLNIWASRNILNRRLFRLANISRQLSHIIRHLTNCYLYRPYRLSWFFSYLDGQSRKISKSH